MQDESARLDDQLAVQALIARDTSLQTTLEDLARVIGYPLGDTRVSIRVWDPDRRTLELIAGEHLSAAFREAMRCVSLDAPAGTCGAAAATRRLAITERIDTDPRWQGLHGLACDEGLAACWAIPVTSAEDELLGTLATYHTKPRAPSEHEQAQLQRAAGLVALTIERHRDRRARLEMEQRFRSLFTQHPDAVFEFDLEGRFLSCNASATRITGFSEAWLKGQRYHGFVAAEDLPTIETAFNRVCQGETQQHIYQSTDADGRDYTLEVTNLPIVVDDRVVGVYGVGRDITRRRAQEQQLRLLARGIDASRNGVIMADASLPDMPLIFVNETFQNLTGYARDEVVGRNCRFLQGPDTDPVTVARLRRAVAERSEIQVTLRNYRKDGSAFWNHLYLGPVLDDEGHCTHMIGIQQDVSRVREYEDRLAHQASHDSLTGLPNRQQFVSRLAQHYRRACRENDFLALLYIDLDDFKPINDGLGHHVGDRLLEQVAQRLVALLDQGDIASRLGSDEFALLLTSVECERDVLARAEAILDTMSRPFELEEYRLHISASIGIASNQDALGQAAELLQSADLAMQEAKQQGRNTWQWYGDEVASLMGEHVEMRLELQEAIREGQFLLHYQPIVDTRTGEVRSVEALVRWQHPEKGMISPGLFIPLAEQTGQIVAIGRWVLQRACQDMARLHAEGGPALPVAVNISPLQFRRAGFLAQVEQVLETSGWPAQRLELEVTEGVLMSGTDRAIEVLHALRRRGVQVAIDDFGSGFSSLRYLRQLPISKVKLDRSFIHDITHNGDNAAIVQGVITMAHHLGLKVVAEGIETPEQRRDLMDRQCDLLQGFLFSHAVPLDRLARLPAHLPPPTA
ncbi:EAL domain-containing protein [Halomonas sp. 1390]|uniref:sensor domain-containing phosphodiesterase n=1 Tax=Halomonas sp. B23F22_3 TaxID=3459516 RepID=UPI00373F0EA3